MIPVTSNLYIYIYISGTDHEFFQFDLKFHFFNTLSSSPLFSYHVIFVVCLKIPYSRGEKRGGVFPGQMMVAPMPTDVCTYLNFEHSTSTWESPQL